MNVWKALLLAFLLGLALWFLSPSRTIAPNEPGLVEVSYLGQSGADAAAVADAFRIFEAESRAAPEQTPRAIKQQIQRVFLSAWLAECPRI